MGSFGKFKALCIKNKNALILALPVTLSLACVIHLLIAFIIAKFTNTNFYFNTSWSYLETSIFALILSLFNSVPYLLRIIRLKSTSSFAKYTILAKSCTGFIELFNITSSAVLEFILFFSDVHWWTHSAIYKDGTYDSALFIMIVRWTTDIIGNIVGWTAAIIAVTYKIKNWNKKNENFKPYWKEKQTSLIISVFFALSAAAICISLYFKFFKVHWDPIAANSKKSFPEFRIFLFFLTTFMTCLSAWTAAPTIVKIIITRNTYSISLLSKVSLLSSMFVWTILDFQTANSFEQFFPIIIGDFFTIMWTSIYIIVKSMNLHQAKKMNLTEKEFCELKYSEYLSKHKV
ncbi:MAG: hypothetical protein LBH55_01945 [Mycoplasmataceae bacterium]|nr:hypothetical protein [Mycoplasmataceae bacterium]